MVPAIEAILNAHTNKDAVQAMALGALKMLSYDSVCKAPLCSHGAPSLIQSIMQQHDHNATIQSEGCIILGNLAQH